MENLIKMDDLGVPLFLETPKYIQEKNCSLVSYHDPGWKKTMRMRRIRRSLPLLAPFPSLLICLASQEIHRKTYPPEIYYIDTRNSIRKENEGDIFLKLSIIFGIHVKFRGCKYRAFLSWNAMEDSGWGREKDGSSLEVVLSWFAVVVIHGWSTPPPERTFAKKQE